MLYLLERLHVFSSQEGIRIDGLPLKPLTGSMQSGGGTGAQQPVKIWKPLLE